MTHRERMLRDFTRECAERYRSVAWGGEPQGSATGRLARLDLDQRPVDPAALAALLTDEFHLEAGPGTSAANVADWLAGFDLGFLREPGRFPHGGAAGSDFGVVFDHRPATTPHSCLEVVRDVTRHPPGQPSHPDNLVFLSKGTAAGDPRWLRLLRALSDFTSGVGRLFPEELAVVAMARHGDELATMARHVCRRLYFASLPAADEPPGKQKSLSRYLAWFLLALADLLAATNEPLPPALRPVLACIAARNRTADGLFFPEEVLAWCKKSAPHGGMALTRAEVEGVLRDGGALLAPDPAVIAILRWLDGNANLHPAAPPNADVVLAAWRAAGCQPALAPERLREVFALGGCVRWRKRDLHPVRDAFARFVTEGPAVTAPTSPAARIDPKQIAAWWNQRHQPAVDPAQVEPLVTRGQQLNKLDRPVLIAWAWLRAGGRAIVPATGKDETEHARAVLHWWRKLRPEKNHLTNWAATPKAVAELAAVLEWLRPSRSRFPSGRRPLHFEARWSTLRQALDSFVMREFAIPPALWQRALAGVWQRSGFAFLRLGSHDAALRSRFRQA